VPEELQQHPPFDDVAHLLVRAPGSESLDRSVNARRWLKTTFLSLEPPFEGRANGASFTSWQLVPGGWFEQRPTQLLQDGSHFLDTTGTESLQLADGVTMWPSTICSIRVRTRSGCENGSRP